MTEQQEQPQEQKQEMSYELEQMDGLGDKSIPKLNALGIHNIRDLAVSGTADIAQVMEKSTDWVLKKLIVPARILIGMEDDDLKSASELEELELNRKRIVTGIDDLDNLLGGGIETRCITEFYGKFGSGKTQLCITLSAIATLPEKFGGLDGNTLYIDAEGTFSVLRLKEIAEKRKMDPKKVADMVFKKRPESAAILELYVENISRIVEEKNIKLIVVDSIIILHRQEYIGREQLSRRQQKLSAVMNKLLKIAESYNIAVVITNQISSDPGADPRYKQETDHATGGNVIAHASTHRIYLERLSNRIKAVMIDSPKLKRTECYFTLSEKGIDKHVERPLKGKIPE
jgi:DNA repair protein RadA